MTRDNGVPSPGVRTYNLAMRVFANIGKIWKDPYDMYAARSCAIKMATGDRRMAIDSALIELCQKAVSGDEESGYYGLEWQEVFDLIEPPCVRIVRAIDEFCESRMDRLVAYFVIGAVLSGRRAHQDKGFQTLSGIMRNPREGK